MGRLLIDDFTHPLLFVFFSVNDDTRIPVAFAIDACQLYDMI